MRILLPLLTAALFAAGCGGDDEQAGTSAEVPAEASLSDMNRSGISGSARLVQGEGGIDVELSLEGAPTDTKYIARIYRGQCGDRGPEIVSLGHVSMTESGGTLLERIDPGLLTPGQRYYVEVRTPDHTPVSCANLDLSPLDLSAPAAGAGTVRQEPPRLIEEAGEGGGQAASEGIRNAPDATLNVPPPSEPERN